MNVLKCILVIAIYLCLFQWVFHNGEPFTFELAYNNAIEFVTDIGSILSSVVNSIVDFSTNIFKGFEEMFEFFKEFFEFIKGMFG